MKPIIMSILANICLMHSLSRRMKWAGHVAHGGNVQKILVLKPEGKRPLGRSRHIWENNIKMLL
jgi:hypothetical protein